MKDLAVRIREYSEVRAQDRLCRPHKRDRALVAFLPRVLKLTFRSAVAGADLAFLHELDIGERPLEFVCLIRGFSPRLLELHEVAVVQALPGHKEEAQQGHGHQ